MLGRKGYSTYIDREFKFDGSCRAINVSGGLLDRASRPVVLVGTGINSLQNLEVWQRLLASEFGPSDRIAIVLLDCEDRTEAALCVPRSRIDRLHFGDSKDWPQQDREFAWIPKKSLLMVGQPTEEAWEEFVAAARAALTTES